MEKKNFDKLFWDDRYGHQNTTWDIGEISSPLKEYIDQLTDKSVSILIPGCGNAYEAAYLLEKGFKNITLVDISAILVKNIRQKLQAYDGKELRIICNDFFKLEGHFDLIIEQT